MRYLGSPFCPVCTEALVEEIHHLTNPVKSFSPAFEEIEPEQFPITFKLDLIKPNPNTLKINCNLTF